MSDHKFNKLCSFPFFSFYTEVSEKAEKELFGYYNQVIFVDLCSAKQV